MDSCTIYIISVFCVWKPTVDYYRTVCIVAYSKDKSSTEFGDRISGTDSLSERCSPRISPDTSSKFNDRLMFFRQSSGTTSPPIVPSLACDALQACNCSKQTAIKRSPPDLIPMRTLASGVSGSDFMSMTSRFNHALSQKHAERLATSDAYREQLISSLDKYSELAMSKRRNGSTPLQLDSHVPALKRFRLPSGETSPSETSFPRFDRGRSDPPPVVLHRTPGLNRLLNRSSSNTDFSQFSPDRIAKYGENTRNEAAHVNVITHSSSKSGEKPNTDEASPTNRTVWPKSETKKGLSGQTAFKFPANLAHAQESLFYNLPWFSNPSSQALPVMPVPFFHPMLRPLSAYKPFLPASGVVATSSIPYSTKPNPSYDVLSHSPPVGGTRNRPLSSSSPDSGCAEATENDLEHISYQPQAATDLPANMQDLSLEQVTD